MRATVSDGQRSWGSHLNVCVSRQLWDDLFTRKPHLAAMFATPALCQSQYCGPVLDELLALRDAYADKLTMAHVEIYTSNRGATPRASNSSSTSPRVVQFSIP